MRQSLVRFILVGLFILLAACAGQPSLPRHAAIERAEQPGEQTNFAAVIESADVIYFPSDRAVFGARAEPAALLMEAMERSGHPFAVGWDLIDVSQQNLLEALPGTAGPAREELIGRLDLVGSGRTREHCRAVLRNIRAPGASHLALRLPAVLIAKLAAGEALTPEEEKVLPRGFTPPSGGLEAYAERLRVHDVGDAGLGRSYRLELLRSQFIAERIVRQVRSAGSGARLVVFLASSDLRPESGVPYFVAQKSRVRQLVLAPDLPPREQPRMLAAR